jgi:hypothetical protein
VFDPSDEEILRHDKLPTDGPGLLEFFRLRVAHDGDEARIKRLIRQLGDDDFDRREEASLQLTGVGLRAKLFLTAALDDPDAEIAWRAKDCIKQIDEGSAEASTAAAIRMLAKLKPDGSAAALLNFLPSAGDESLAEEVRLTLADLAVRDGKADPALTKALTDASSLKRGAAAFALGRAKDDSQLPEVRKLLQDSDPVVRYRAALALAAAREKEAVPVLIELLDQLPRLETSRTEELLYRIADDKAPTLPTLVDAAARRKYRDAWKAWWDDNGAKVDAARLGDTARTVGFTLVVLLDQGRIVELDSANQVRVQFSQFVKPLDAQLLPDDHILVAEHDGNRVTERNAKNEVVWEKQIANPLAAQRLPDGGTFIATQNQLVELNPKGEEVFNYQRPNGDMIMKAERLRNGGYGLVTQLGATRFVELDAKGQERRGFNVDLRYSGGRIDVLPNGDVLIPEAGNNRVVELDTKGSLVWEAHSEQPIAAVRLPNGNTLITSFSEHRAVEVDHDGKDVWEYRKDTRVTRAFRR